MAKKKAALFHRDGGYCFYCGRAMLESDMTIEHLVSRDKGGPDHMDNLVLVHLACNRAADNLPIKKKIELHVKGEHGEIYKEDPKK